MDDDVMANLRYVVALRSEGYSNQQVAVSSSSVLISCNMLPVASTCYEGGKSVVGEEEEDTLIFENILLSKN